MPRQHYVEGEILGDMLHLSVLCPVCREVVPISHPVALVVQATVIGPTTVGLSVQPGECYREPHECLVLVSGMSGSENGS